MPYVTALLLDRGNDLQVRWRLKGRHPCPSRPDVEAYRQSPPEPFYPSPVELPRFEPRPAAGELWEAEAPWPGADGPNRRWLAARVVARNDGDRAAHEQDPARPAVILLHGWLVSRSHIPLYQVWARALARRGLDVWLPRLPHHLERAAPGAISGERCLSSDLIGTAESIRQGVAETRALAAWLRQEGTPAVGLWGTSLGGWVAALCATIESDWQGVSLWAPVADPGQVLWEAELTRDMRAAVVEAGIRRGEEAVALGVLAPVERCLQVSRPAVQLVAGLHDQIVDVRTVVRLARAWGVDVLWQPHGHISLDLSRRALATTVDFLGRMLRH